MSAHARRSWLRPRACRRSRLAACAVVIALASAAVATSAPARADDPATTVTVDAMHPFGNLPADFVGLSYEMRELSSACTTGDCLGGFDADKGNLVALFKTLGRSNIRISGNTLDRDTLWVPAGEQPPDPLPDWVKDVVTPADIARLGQFLTETGWRAEVGINLAHYEPRLAADEAHTLLAVLGRHLSGAECGNEPNHYASNGYRSAPYGFAQHKLDWEACADAVGSSRIAAPDLSAPTSTADWFTQFAQAEHDRVNMLTVHNYTGATTTSQLLSPQVRASEVSNVASQLAAAQAVHLPIRLDETNSAVGGGVPGVSDTYASALWALDYSLAMAQAGFDGLNFHGGLGICDAPLFNGKYQRYTPICAATEADRQAGIYTVMPEYYGLYMATRMGSGRFLPVSVSSERNVTAYAVRGNDGRTRIAIVEKDDTSDTPVPVTIDFGAGDGMALVSHLTGDSLDSADGVTVQGAGVSRTGHLAPRPGDPVAVHEGTINLTVDSGSAAIITLPSTA